MSCTDVVHTKLKLLQIARYDNVCIVPLPSTSSLPAGSPAQTGPRGTWVGGMGHRASPERGCPTCGSPCCEYRTEWLMCVRVCGGGAIDDMLAVQSKANKVLFDTPTCFYVLATLCYSHLQFTLHYMYVHSYPAICHEKLPWKTAHSAWDTLGPTIGVTASYDTQWTNNQLFNSYMYSHVTCVQPSSAEDFTSKMSNIHTCTKCMYRISSNLSNSKKQLFWKLSRYNWNRFLYSMRSVQNN